MLVIIPELRDQRQERYKFQVSLGYPVSPYATRLPHPKERKKEIQYREVFSF